MAQEKDLSTLVRLKKWQVDEEQRVMADILGRIAEVENRQNMLEEHVRTEQQVASNDPQGAGFGYGQFANAMIMVREQLADARKKLEAEYTAQQEKVAEAFRDFKTVEQLQKNRDDRQQKERNRKEQINLDEMAANAHRRKSENL